MKLARGKSVLRAGVSLGVLVTLAGTQALAQPKVDEIVVTVQKREESIQNVPIAVIAYKGDFIQSTNLDDVKDLIKFSPGVSGNSKDSFIDVVTIRGILTNDFGIGGDPSVAFFKNNLYQGRNGAVVTSLYDVERAEVLRGPQGFLFGRNAIAGAISIHTAKPDLDGVGGYIQFDGGERDHYVADGALNIPLNEKLAVRLAAYYSTEDGYVDNFAVPGKRQIENEKAAVRFSARYKNDTADINLMVEYEDRKQSGTVYRATQLGGVYATLASLRPGLTIRGNNRDIDSDQGLGEFDDSQILSIGLQADFDLGWATFTSLTGFKDHDYKYAEDFDGTPLRINDYRQIQEGNYLEQEFRLVSETDGPLSWYAGVSAYREEIEALFSQAADEDIMCAYYNYYGLTNCTDLFAYYYYPAFTPSPEGLLEENIGKGEYWGWAAYLDVNYQVTDKIEVGAGLRYSYDRKDFALSVLPVSSDLGPFFVFGFTTSGFLSSADSWDAFTPRLFAKYRPTEDWMFYATISRGYKAGGFGSFAIDGPPVPVGGVATTANTAQAFDPEKVWSYEAGTKVDLFDDRVRVNLTGYYYEYKDLQLTTFITGGGTVVVNVGEAKGHGIEGTMQAVLNDYVDVFLSAAYGDSKLTNAQLACDGTTACEGNRLPTQPKYSGSAVVNFTYPLQSGSLVASAEVAAQTAIYGGLKLENSSRVGGWADLTLRVGYESPTGWSLIAYVENVTDAVYFDGAVEESGIIPASRFGVSRPRTFGAVLKYKFGG